jgi:hypothetical protein
LFESARRQRALRQTELALDIIGRQKRLSKILIVVHGREPSKKEPPREPARLRDELKQPGSKF